MDIGLLPRCNSHLPRSRVASLAHLAASISPLPWAYCLEIHVLIRSLDVSNIYKRVQSNMSDYVPELCAIFTCDLSASNYSTS